MVEVAYPCAGSATIRPMTLGEVAERLGAELLASNTSSQGAAEIVVTGVAGIEAAGPAEISFVANPKYARLARKSRAAALVVEPAFAALPLPTLRVRNPKLAFTRLVSLFHPPFVYLPGVHPTAVIAASAAIGNGAHIGPYVVIGENVRLGANAVVLAHVVLYPGAAIGDRFFAHSHAVVREGCRLGDDVVLGNGAIIGGDGFGFAQAEDGSWIKTPHPGPVILEDHVEVQAHACIDRAVVGQTRVGRGTKIDNLVQVGHACTVGQDTLLCAQVGLAGSTRIGQGVILAGQVGVAGHLTVGDGVVATAQTGIPGDVEAGKVVSGYPAMDNRAWLKMTAALQRVPELIRRSRQESTS